MDIFNKVSVILGVVGGYAAAFLGGWDKFLVALVTLIVIDYASGVIKAIYTKQLSSEIGYRGIAKKVLLLLIVALSVVLQKILPGALPLREITILFFVANEGLSILENAAEIIPLPAQLKSVLLQIRGTSQSTDINSQIFDDDSSDSINSQSPDLSEINKISYEQTKTEALENKSESSDTQDE